MSAWDPDELVPRLQADGLSLAVGESCTAGLVGGQITSSPGASKVFLGGAICYSNDMKVKLLGVDAELFDDGHGAVSATVAEQMAEGARKKTGADIGLAVTGIAGPTGGTAQKPVGTVWLACVGPGDRFNVHRLQAEGGRREIREAAVTEALRLLCRNLDEVDTGRSKA